MATSENLYQTTTEWLEAGSVDITTTVQNTHEYLPMRVCISDNQPASDHLGGMLLHSASRTANVGDRIWIRANDYADKFKVHVTTGANNPNTGITIIDGYYDGGHRVAQYESLYNVNQIRVVMTITVNSHVWTINQFALASNGSKLVADNADWANILNLTFGVPS